MRKNGVAPALVAAVLVVAALCTVVVRGGWLVWGPVLLTLAVVGGLFSAPRR